MLPTYSFLTNMAFTPDQISQIKLLLDVQAKGYSDSIDRLYGEMNSLRKRYDEKIHDLEISLEYSYKTMEELKRNVVAKDAFVKHENVTKSDIENLKIKLNKQEDYSRKHNIRIDGIEELKAETSEQTHVKVTNMIKQCFNVANIDIDIAHRVGSPNSRQGSRTILAKLAKLSDRDFILRNTSKLKNSSIYIYEDLSEGTMQIRKSKMPQLKQARESGKVAYFVRDKLVIKNRNYANLPSNNINQQLTPSRSVSTLVNVFSSPRTPKTDLNTHSSSLQQSSTDASSLGVTSIDEDKGNPRRSNRLNNSKTD